jgi:hypothetical protein
MSDWAKRNKAGRFSNPPVLRKNFVEALKVPTQNR